jgi:2-phosphosulfolactate phosphatase
VIVRRTGLIDGARAATGVAVIVDVFRAFTTAAFCVAAGATEIVLVSAHEEALAMKARDPRLFLVGEIKGRPIPGFDAGNSPSAIDGLDLSGRRVVQRTSQGTQGVVAATHAEAIVLGSFVVAGATAQHLRGRNEVTIVAMGEAGTGDTSEDQACAAYLESLLLRGEGDAPGAVANARAAAERRVAPGGVWPDWFPRRDADLALEVDRFSFALPVHREDGLLIARPAFS